MGDHQFAGRIAHVGFQAKSLGQGEAQRFRLVAFVRLMPEAAVGKYEHMNSVLVVKVCGLFQ
jgi:hypothetical protein